MTRYKTVQVLTANGLMHVVDDTLGCHSLALYRDKYEAEMDCMKRNLDEEELNLNNQFEESFGC